MSVRVSVNLSGLNARRVGVRGKVADVVAVAAHRIEANGKRIIEEKKAVDTGATMNSIQAKERDGSQGMIYDVGPSTDYATYIEEGYHTRGGRHVPGRPFMQPALETERNAFIAAVKYVVQHG